MSYTAEAKHRIERLEDELLRRPLKGDVAHTREKLARREAMYEAAIKRNEVLSRRLRDAEARIKELERADDRAA